MQAFARSLGQRDMTDDARSRLAPRPMGVNPSAGTCHTHRARRVMTEAISYQKT
jgi:hypothetical protein